MAAHVAVRSAVAEFAQCERGRPFLWGSTDCVSLVLRGLTYTGHLVPAPTWTDVSGALREYRATGGLVQYLRESGWRKVSLSHVSAGDVVVLPRTNPDGFPGVGLVVGATYLSSDAERGVHVTTIGRAGGLAYGLTP